MWGYVQTAVRVLATVRLQVDSEVQGRRQLAQLKEMMTECNRQMIGRPMLHSSGIAWSLSVKSLGIVYRSVQLNVWPTYDTYSHTKRFHDRSNTQEHVLWVYGMKQF